MDCKTPTDLKVDLAAGCEFVLDMLDKQLDHGYCEKIVRVDIGYFYSHAGGPSLLRPSETLSTLSDDAVLLIIQRLVSYLPNIKTFVIMSYFRSETMSLPVSALKIIFQEAIRMEILFLHQIRLQGLAGDFEAMSNAVREHTSLKRVNLHHCRAKCMGNEDRNVTTEAYLDSLIYPLASLPTLHFLSLDQVLLTEASVNALTKSVSLRDLSFYNIPELKLWICNLLQSIQQQSLTQQNLRGLRIRSCNLGCKEAAECARMLERNTSLESLVLYCDSLDDYGTIIGKSLQKNTTIRRLELGIGKSGESLVDMGNTISAGVSLVDHESAAKSIAAALTKNTSTSLRHLCLCLGNGSGHEIYQAYMPYFEEMLETNFTLESFLLQGVRSFSVVSPKVEFLMRLNQRSVLGRKRLFQENARVQQKNSTNRWLESLVQHHNDLSIIYYVLSRNPAIVASMLRE